MTSSIQMDMLRSFLRRMRKSHKKFFRHPSPFIDFDNATFDFSGQTASDLIRQTLASSDPCMICRMGATEMTAVLTYMAIREKDSLFNKSVRHIRGNIPCFWWDDKTISTMSDYSGFFPANEKNLDRFAERILKDIKNVDILGSWLCGEKTLLRSNTSFKTVPLEDLEPYRHKQPWSIVLKDKKVLVVHPFKESIRSQFTKRKLLFQDHHVLPDFELLTLKAVQSVAGSKVDFADWFEALDWMCEKTSDINFDIAIIGAGAYGLALASYVKSIGKKAVHMGGATQILFGIRGKRWDERPFYQQLYNEHWVRPLPVEVPDNFKKVDSGCYW